MIGAVVITFGLGVIILLILIFLAIVFLRRRP